MINYSKKKYLLFIILFLSCRIVLACSCKSNVSNTYEGLVKAYDRADHVALGFYSTDGTSKFSFQTIEILKGDELDCIRLETKHSCHFIPEPEELWLLFLEDNKGENTFSVSFCDPNYNFLKYSIAHRHPEALSDIEVQNQINHHQRGMYLLDVIRKIQKSSQVNDSQGAMPLSTWVLVVLILFQIIVLTMVYQLRKELKILASK